MKFYDRQAVCHILTEPQVRVVVQWGQTPADYDLHLVGPTTVTPSDGSPSNRFHVWYSRKSYSEKGRILYIYDGDPSGKTYTASLVQDDTTSYGPRGYKPVPCGGGTICARLVYLYIA